ncbi:MAG: adenine deaminase, partial [Bacilli bacterium]|nr:adenine deaminase [Bacilli bacterium]
MLEKYIQAASKKELCDLVLKHASYVDVFEGEIKQGDIAIKDDRIVGIGEYQGKKEIDASGKIVVPGFIDGHVHIESSQASPEEFAAMIVPHGTTSIIADPHELANVLGIPGVDYVIKAAKNVPLDIHVQLPSCVPATPFETSGAVLDGEAIEKNIVNPEINGLGEFMAYPQVISADPDTLRKLEAAHKANKIIDGHAPFLQGEALNAYLCGGISTDHECGTVEEMREKISKGVYCHLRVGSYTRSLELVKAITPWNYRRVILCTDDKHASEIKENGHLDHALKRVVAEGLDPIVAVSLATLNAAEAYRLHYRGAIAPFYYADLVLLDDLKDFRVSLVLKDGKPVAENGKP